jgi:predicted nucleic acid-binding protein
MTTSRKRGSKSKRKRKCLSKKHIAEGNIELVWSYILDFENGNNPFLEKRNAIAAWKNLAVAYLDETEDIIQSAEQIAESGVKESDALHVAAAIAGNCDYFVTTDDGIKCPNAPVKIVNPMDFIKDWRDNCDNRHRSQRFRNETFDGEIRHGGR